MRVVVETHKKYKTWQSFEKEEENTFELNIYFKFGFIERGHSSENSKLSSKHQRKDTKQLFRNTMESHKVTTLWFTCFIPFPTSPRTL